MKVKALNMVLLLYLRYIILLNQLHCIMYI